MFYTLIIHSMKTADAGTHMSSIRHRVNGLEWQFIHDRLVHQPKYRILGPVNLILRCAWIGATKVPGPVVLLRHNSIISASPQTDHQHITRETLYFVFNAINPHTRTYIIIHKKLIVRHIHTLKDTASSCPSPSKNSANRHKVPSHWHARNTHVTFTNTSGEDVIGVVKGYANGKYDVQVRSELGSGDTHSVDEGKVSELKVQEPGACPVAGK